MSTGLKPCPFCGGKVQQESYIVEACVFCTSCDARVRVYHEPKEDTGTAKSAEVWNNRAPQWLPIESAPRDGSTILVYGKAYRTPGKPSQPYPARWSRGWWMEGASVVIEYVTHWQPLPAPPEVQP